MNRLNSPLRVGRVFQLIAGGRFDMLWYGLWIRLRGLDLGVASLKELGLTHDAKDHVSSGGPELARVLRSIEIPAGSRALDLGSGKGGAVFTFSRFAFAEILGVEISEKLVCIAKANAARLGLQGVRFICLDAAQFNDLDRFTHIYLFNPFSDAVMKVVMDHLASSLARKPRRLTVILKCPGSPSRMINPDIFTKQREFTFPGSNPFYIYVHDCPFENPVNRGDCGRRA